MPEEAEAVTDQPPAPQLRDPLQTDLHYFHELALQSFRPLTAGEFRRVPGWSKKACNGKVFKYVWKHSASINPDGELVVVKVMQSDSVDKERIFPRCDRDAFRYFTDAPEDSLNEIGIYCFLREIRTSHTPNHCPYVLQVLDAFRDETTHKTWLVLEQCGHDLYDKLENLRASNVGLHELDVMRYIHQLLSAVCHLHAHNIGHRDISLENLLIKGDDLRLMDFGQAVRLRNEDGVEYRYFRKCGKDYYRAPECYLPTQLFHATPIGTRVMFVGPPQMAASLGIRFLETGIVQAIAEDGSHCILRLDDGREKSAVPFSVLRQERQFVIPMPDGEPPGSVRQISFMDAYLCDVRFCEADPGQRPRAEVYGYAAAPVDIFACGVAFFIMHAQAPPWRLAAMSDNGFRYAARHGAHMVLNVWQRPMSEQAAPLLEGLLNFSSSRWTAAQALQCPWFETLRVVGTTA